MIPVKERDSKGKSRLVALSDPVIIDPPATYEALLRDFEALRRSEAALRDYVESSTISLHWVGEDGTILWANQAELDLLGYQREEYVGRNIVEFHADPDVINEILSCLGRGEALHEYPARLRHRDGSIRHVVINSSVLFEDGKFIHTRCFTRDVTGEREAQQRHQEMLEALRESQAQLAAELADSRLLQEISAQLIEQGDEDALYTKLVDAAATIMRSDFATMQMLHPDRGGPKGELRLLACRGLSVEEAKVWEWVRMDTASTCGQALRTGKRVIVANIETCDFLAGTTGMAALLNAGIHAAQSTPLFSRNGRMLGMISSHWCKPHAPTERDLRLLDILARQAADLIERKLTEGKLKEREKQLYEILEAIPAAVYTTDAEGRITFFNRAAVEFSGRVPQLGNDSWCVTWKLYNTDGTPLPHDECPMAMALKERRQILGCEAIAERPDGERRNFAPYPTPLFDAEGRLTGAVNMLVDITDRKRAEATLRQSEERFRAIFETTPECVKVVAADGTLLHMNPPGLAMVEAENANAVIGKIVYDLIAPQDRESFRAFNERVCRGEKASLEFDIIGLQGTRRHMETYAAPMREPDGSFVQLGVTRDITERRRAEETRLLLAAIVDSSDDAIISKDLGGIITSWNKGAERLFGFSATEAISRTVTELLVPEDRQDEEPMMLNTLRAGERIEHYETFRRRKDGSLLNVSLTVSPVKDQRGRIIGASKIARDITKQKSAEDAIRTLNVRLSEDLEAMTRMQQLSTRLIQTGGFDELLAQILDAGIEITRADMGHIQLLDRFGRLKITAHRGFDAPFLEFFDEVPDGLSACGTALQKGERVIVEDVTLSPIFAGTPGLQVMLDAQAVAVQSTPLVSRSGQVLGMFSTHYRRSGRPSERELRLLDLLARQAADLIERRRGEQSRSQLSAIVESTGDAIYIYDFDGTMLAWNRAAEQMYGYASEEILGRHAELIVPADRMSELTNVLVPAIQKGETLKNFATMRARRDGTTFPALLTISPIRDEHGHPVAISVISRDMTDLKRAEDELRRANQDLEQFAYSASHDLQEPLRTINIYSGLLLANHAAADGEAAEYFGYLRSAATRMEMLVRDLLTYTQMNRIELPSDEVNAAGPLSAALANLQQAVRESDAVVTFDEMPNLRIHTTHLQQLFQNLIGNAIKYRDPVRRPAVHVGAERRNGSWIFSVSDNGIGIQPEYKEKIFGLFTRLHGADSYSGTGIGLAICQRIVERYHGRIWVESEPGTGSEFRFTIPV